jgi:hypothetical protein
MAKLTKRTVGTTEIRSADYLIWDEELPGFGLRVFASGKRSYVVRYRAAGRSRRYTIGLHGVWTPEEARREGKVLLGQVARGGNPAEERKLDCEAITVKELCARYLEDLRNGLVLGKRGRPKKAATISTDMGRIERHIIPLYGIRRVGFSQVRHHPSHEGHHGGKTRASVKTDKLRGRAIVRGGAGTAARTIGLFGGILTYAVELGIIEQNPVHGVCKPKDQVNTRRLSEQEYRTLGDILRTAVEGREIRNHGGNDPGDRPDGLPAQRSHRSALERNRCRRQLPAPGRQHGGRVRAPDRPAGPGIPRGSARRGTGC